MPQEWPHDGYTGYTIALEDLGTGEDSLSGENSASREILRPEEHLAIRQASVYATSTRVPFKGYARTPVPEKILAMRRLYQYGSDSFALKCKNFYRQGKFMEDYEDDLPYTGSFTHYFPTYHDLDIRQLRGYFTWRTLLRKGQYTPIAISLAYIYLYELMNGIGVKTPAQCLQKMQDFETGFLDAGLGNDAMRRNLRRWEMEFALTHDMPPETVREYADPDMLKQDTAILVLRDPDTHEDQEIFDALCLMNRKNVAASPLAVENAPLAARLFASVWRHASASYLRDGRGLFETCFGKRRVYHWHPLSNAVIYRTFRHPDTALILDGCRTYACRGGSWYEKRYDSLYYNKNLMNQLLHAADGVFRAQFRTGHKLKEREEEAWALPYILEAVAGEKQRQIEEKRPEITIDYSGLGQIRADAAVTRDSLLTDEEMDTAAEEEAATENNRSVREAHMPPDAETGGAAAPVQTTEEASTDQTAGETAQTTQDDTYDATAGGAEDALAAGNIPGLDAIHTQILVALLDGAPVDELIRSHHLMPSVVADTINEALFDEIGDSVVESDGGSITLVEDYREDVLALLRG